VLHFFDIKILEKIEDLYDLREALAAQEEADPQKRISLRDLASQLNIALTEKTSTKKN